MQHWLRKVSVEFSGGTVNPGGVQLHELKVAFDVSASISSAANSATIEIWNLNEGHRNAVGKELDTVTLIAGYQSGTGIIFKGNLRDAEHRRDGMDIITTLKCGDGDKAFRRATISKTFEKGTSVEEVVEEIYSELAKEGIDRGEWKFPDDMPKFKRPYSMCGSCTREMDRLGRGRGFYWSSQNHAMEIIPGDGFIGGMYLISPETGMIDSPTITDNGVKVSALLNPFIRPGHRIQVESQTTGMNGANGVYRVSELAFSGDNRDGDFRVDIHGEAVKGGKVDEGLK